MGTNPKVLQEDSEGCFESCCGQRKGRPRFLHPAAACEAVGVGPSRALAPHSRPRAVFGRVTCY